MAPVEDEKLALPKKDNETQVSIESRESQHFSNLVSPFGLDNSKIAKTALTNSLVLRDRNKDPPWVYCFKVKRDRLKLNQLLTSKSTCDVNVERLLPAL